MNEENELADTRNRDTAVTEDTVYNSVDTKNGIMGSRDIKTDERKHKRKMNPNSLKNLVPIKPGQVLNPTGRPKTPDEVRQKLRDALGDAVDRLIELSEHADKDSVRYQATQDLIDRVLGKPTQPLDIDQNNAVKVEFVGGTDDLAK